MVAFLLAFARKKQPACQPRRTEGFSDTMGHAGALVRHADGMLEGAVDPRSDGIVAAV